MKILADKYLFALDRMISDEFDLVTYDPDNGFPADAIQFDAMLLRTVTSVNADILPETGNLKFIGSAAAGVDHIDQEHLRERGVKFASSAGCNANAVAEYVLTVLFRWSQIRGESLQNLKIGVIGCGNTGGALIGYLEKLGVRFEAYDPPKQKRQLNFYSSSLEDLFSCNILTFHTPLTEDGPNPTFHLCSEEWLNNGFKLIINTSRGGVVNEKALIQARRTFHVRDFILDVWENEPVFSDEMAYRALIATPHIAGYSREAKWKATEMVAQKLHKFFDIPFAQPISNEKVDRSQLASPKHLSFPEFLWKNHKIDYYDSHLREIIGQEDDVKAQRFANLRSTTETRFEFKSILREYPKGTSLPSQVRIFR